MLNLSSFLFTYLGLAASPLSVSVMAKTGQSVPEEDLSLLNSVNTVIAGYHK